MYNTSHNNTAPSVLRPPTIAIIDDDRDLTRAVTRILKSNYNCVVNGFGSVEEFLCAVDHHAGGSNVAELADLILLDFHLPGQNGPFLVRELKKRNSNLLTRSRIMGITGDAEATIATRFRDAGIDDVFLKPLRQIDFGHIADRAYRLSLELDSQSPLPAFKGTI